MHRSGCWWIIVTCVSLPKAGFLANCLLPHLHTTSITRSTYHNHTYSTTTTTQCKLLYAQVVLGKRPPAQVAEGNHHKCLQSVCASCWNEKHHQCKLLKVRETGHQHPSAQVGAGCSNNATCTWAQLRCKCPCASCILLLHPAPTCADGCWCPVPLTFSNLRWWCFHSSN